MTSCQPRPQPHSSGMAATRATIGTATNRPTRNRWNVELGSSSKSGLAARGSVVTLTVSVEVVIVLPWVRA